MKWNSLFISEKHTPQAKTAPGNRRLHTDVWESPPITFSCIVQRRGASRSSPNVSQRGALEEILRERTVYHDQGYDGSLTCVITL